MLKVVSQKTVELIREKIINTQLVKLPVNDETIQIIYDWFEDEEICLANAEADGEVVDQTYFRDICLAVNELFIGETEAINIDDLNEKLSCQK